MCSIGWTRLNQLKNRLKVSNQKYAFIYQSEIFIILNGDVLLISQFSWTALYLTPEGKILLLRAQHIARGIDAISVLSSTETRYPRGKTEVPRSNCCATRRAFSSM